MTDVNKGCCVTHRCNDQPRAITKFLSIRKAQELYSVSIYNLFMSPGGKSDSRVEVVRRREDVKRSIRFHLTGATDTNDEEWAPTCASSASAFACAACKFASISWLDTCTRHQAEAQPPGGSPPPLHPRYSVSVLVLTFTLLKVPASRPQVGGGWDIHHGGLAKCVGTLAMEERETRMS
eukprot:1196258-Prorocentrum_minimum.AAC.5